MEKKVNVPMRRCVGCMQSKPKQELLKVAGKDGAVAVDRSGRAHGRGVYICRSLECMELAKKKRAIPRGLHIEVSQERMEELFKELTQILEAQNGEK